MSAADIALKRRHRPSTAPLIWIPLAILLAALAVGIRGKQPQFQSITGG